MKRAIYRSIYSKQDIYRNKKNEAKGEKTMPYKNEAKTEPVKPVFKDFKGLEIQASQATNLAVEHLIATKGITFDSYWETELEETTKKYFEFLTKMKKELI